MTIQSCSEIHKENTPLVTKFIITHFPVPQTEWATEDHHPHLQRGYEIGPWKKHLSIQNDPSASVYLLMTFIQSPSIPFLGIPSPVLVLGTRVQTIQRNYVSLSTLQLQIALIEWYNTTEDVNVTNASPLLIISIGCLTTTRSWWKKNWMPLQWCTMMMSLSSFSPPLHKLLSQWPHKLLSLLIL